MKTDKFKPTIEFFDDLPVHFWEGQYQFAKLCVELGEDRRAKYAELAQVTGDWRQTNDAYRFVEFWRQKYHEAKDYLRQSGMIA